MKKYTATKVNDFDFKSALDLPERLLGRYEKLVPNTAGKDVLPDTSFCVLISEKYLYFRIDAVDNDPRATMTGYNDPLYDEEVLEIFISPTRKHERYFEFEINHLGTVFCAWIDHSETENKINFLDKNPTETAVFKTADGFTVCGRIGLETLYSDGGHADEWLFNVYRIKRPENCPFMLGAYAPTGEDKFHKPECFATLAFES